MQVHIATTAQELDAIIELRYQILRAPWNQSKASARDELEEKSVNAFICDEKGKVIACGRLQENENKIGQIRYMAVAPEYQGKGLGKELLLFLEKSAQEKGFHKVELQARENAVDFYKGNGYTIKEKSFLLWGIIQHYRMEKSL